MATISLHSGGRESARTVPVWDPLVRLIHWTLALTILLNASVVDADGAIRGWIGYVTLSQVGLRVLWAFIGPKHARFSAFPPNPARAIRYLRALLRGDGTVNLSHNPIGALMVYTNWLSVIAIGVTGNMMTTLTYFGLAWVENAHEAAFD